MAKNPRRLQKDSTHSPKIITKGQSIISKRGRKIIIAGIGMVVVGFIVLSYTDPAGKNWASTLSPVLLVVGYGLIGLGIIISEASSMDAGAPNSEKATSPQNN